MRYFVIAHDGAKYGPAEFVQLNQWIQEGRIQPVTLLEEEATGRQFPAGSLPGLQFGMSQRPATTPFGPQNPMGQPMPGPQPSYIPQQMHQPQQQQLPGYYRQPQPMRGNYGAPYGPVPGNGEVVAAFILGGVGLICLPILPSIAGMILAYSAKQKGHPYAQAAFIFCLVTLIVCSIASILWMFGSSKGI